MKGMNVLDKLAKLIKHPDVVYAEDGEEALLYALSAYDSGTDKILFVNNSGRDIWCNCDGTNSIQSIVDIFVAMYPSVSEHVIANDVEAFIGRLVDYGWLSYDREQLTEELK